VVSTPGDRLPHELEWELAAVAARLPRDSGWITRTGCGQSDPLLDASATYAENSWRETFLSDQLPARAHSRVIPAGVAEGRVRSG
jgi:hypothetical protein